MHVDLIIHSANELLTLKGFSDRPKIGHEMRDLGSIPDGAVAVYRERIIDVGSTKDILSKYDADIKINAKGKVVMPGFVDAHTHLVFAGSREDELTLKLEGVPYLEILRKGGGILKTVRLTRQYTHKELIREARERLDIALIHGTTTLEAKSGYGLETKSELKILEVNRELNKEHPIDIVSTFLGAHAIPPEFKDNPDAYVDLIVEEMIPRVAREKLAEFNDVFVEKGVFNKEQARRILLAGKRYGLVPKVHADEFNDMGGAQLAAEVEAISADHLLHASEVGLKAIAESGVIGVLLPATSLTIMTLRFADARKMIRLGVPIALATDLNPNCWVENMQFVLTLAVYGLKLTPAEAISAATINAAHAIGRARTIGSLENGKLADMIILDVPNHKFIGYRFGTNLVDVVVKRGKIVVEDGKIMS